MDNIKKQIIQLINDDKYTPMTVDELFNELELQADDYGNFTVLLRKMKDELYIIITKKNRIISPMQTSMFVGEFISHRKGFGFIKSDKEGIRDLFINSKDINGAMNGDRVVAEISKPASGHQRAEGKIVDIVKRGNREVIGTFTAHENFGFVIPKEKSMGDIYISKKHFNEAKEDDVVLVRILSYPKDDKKAEGVVVEVLGNKDDRGIEIESIIREHGLPLEFDKKVLDNANFVAVPIPEEEYERRKDLRDKMIFTMDGADAKDLDDAVSIEKKGENY